ncbi:hypothetical protein AAIJ31_004404 [Salmonella enterica]
MQLRHTALLLHPAGAALLFSGQPTLCPAQSLHLAFIFCWRGNYLSGRQGRKLVRESFCFITLIL